MTWINNLDPILFSAGPLQVRWYGFLFAAAIMCYYSLARWIFKREKLSLEDLDSLIMYMFVGLVLGARLGHVFFYEADYYLSNPVEILKIWKGGLASHGAAIGLILAFWIWTKVKKVKFSDYIDALSVPITLAAGFIRIGNFFNSEIVGKPTDGSWGVIFERLGDGIPRHPSQFYEAGLAWLAFAIIIVTYLKYKKTPKGFFFFMMLGLYFGGRFIVEFWKERHTLPDDVLLSMGQILSIVPVLAALIYFILWIPLKKRR